MAIDTEAVQARGRALAQGNGLAEQAFDAIVTTDGDADRPLITDETGEWLRGDLLGLLCARELAAATVVTPVNSTTALEASGLFAEVRRTRIGSPHVIAGMAQPAAFQSSVSRPMVVSCSAALPASAGRTSRGAGGAA